MHLDERERGSKGVLALAIKLSLHAILVGPTFLCFIKKKFNLDKIILCPFKNHIELRVECPNLGPATYMMLGLSVRT